MCTAFKNSFIFTFKDEVRKNWYKYTYWYKYTTTSEICYHNI